MKIMKTATRSQFLEVLREFVTDLPDNPEWVTCYFDEPQRRYLVEWSFGHCIDGKYLHSIGVGELWLKLNERFGGFSELSQDVTIQVGDSDDPITVLSKWYVSEKPKPPSPEFIAKAKEITDPQRAKVGDVVKRSDGYVFEVDRREDVIWHGVIGLETNGSGIECVARDGEYTIVKRAEDRATYCQSCKQVKKHTHPKDGLFVCEECDPSPEDCECEERAPELPTSELVEMLAKREAIAFDELVPEDRDAIIQWEKKTNLWSLHTARFKGPARILVIPE